MKKTLLLLLMVIVFTTARGQIKISNVDYLQRIKDGTTYVVMKNPEAASAKEYIEVFKKYWTFSKVEFIKYADIQKYAMPENSFFEVGGFQVTNQGSVISSTSTHFYIELWTVSDKYFKEKKKKISDNDEIEIVRLEIYPDFMTAYSPKNILKYDYDGEDHLYNWGAGFLKNYIQEIMTLLDEGKERSLFANVCITPKVKELKKQTLYVPDYVLIKFNKMTGDESQRLDEKNVFGDYKSKYKVVTKEELNKKILTDTEPFYYLLYVKSSTDKFVSVYNSATGEMIYSVYTPVSYNFGSKDMKNISEK